MALSEVPCLIGQAACGRVAGDPVCPKCGMSERVVYPGQADLEGAQAAALARYMASEVTAKPPPPADPPKPPKPPLPPAQPPKQPEPESPVTPGWDNKGINRLGVGVLVLALMGGGWWWNDQQDQRVQPAEAHLAQAAEQARSERETDKQRLSQEDKPKNVPSPKRFLGALDGLYEAKGNKFEFDWESQRFSLTVGNCSLYGKTIQQESHWNLVANGVDGNCSIIDSHNFGRTVGEIYPERGATTNSGRVLRFLVNFQPASLAPLSGSYAFESKVVMEK